MTLSRKTAKILCVAAVGILLAAYALFDPSYGYFPKCPFLMLTGWQCPGCGSQRAIHSLLHADISSAWGYNALFVLSLPLLALLYAPVRSGWLKLLRRSVWLPRFILAIVLVWWISRNIFI